MTCIVGSGLLRAASCSARRAVQLAWRTSMESSAAQLSDSVCCSQSVQLQPPQLHGKKWMTARFWLWLAHPGAMHACMHACLCDYRHGRTMIWTDVSTYWHIWHKTVPPACVWRDIGSLQKSYSPASFTYCHFGPICPLYISTIHMCIVDMYSGQSCTKSLENENISQM